MRLPTALKQIPIVWALAAIMPAQTLLNLQRQAKEVDFSQASYTRPFRTGPQLPATCSVGEMYFRTDAPAGQNLFGCAATNIWVLEAGGGGSSDFEAQRTSPSSLTVGGTCSSSAPCRARFGNIVIQRVTGATATITAGSGSGVARVFLSESGDIVLQHPSSAGLTVSASGMVAQQVASPTFPNSAIPIAEVPITAGQWGAVSDRRAFLSTSPNGLPSGCTEEGQGAFACSGRIAASVFESPGPWELSGETSAEPAATPAAEMFEARVDRTNKNLVVLNDAGNASVTVYPVAPQGSEVLTGLGADGAFIRRQLSYNDIGGTPPGGGGGGGFERYRLIFDGSSSTLANGQTISWTDSGTQWTATWTVPAGVRWVRVEAWGAGAGGGGGSSAFGGVGGGGGGYLDKLCPVTPESTVTIKVGKGSAGSTGYVSQGNGGTSEFGACVIVLGGRGDNSTSGMRGGYPQGWPELSTHMPAGYQASNVFAVAFNSTTVPRIPVVPWLGGGSSSQTTDGNPGGVGGPSLYGGGSGGGGGFNNPTGGVGGASAYGGSGGNGGGYTSGGGHVPCTAGSIPGGGGGGGGVGTSSPASMGCAGARGEVRVYY